MLVVVACSSGKGMCTSSSDREWLDCPKSGQGSVEDFERWLEFFVQGGDICFRTALFFFLSYLSLEGM